MDASKQPIIPEQATAAEQRTGYLSSEFIAGREGCWTSIDGRLVFIGCGDDRGPTADSAAALMEGKSESVMSPQEGYASIYGATAGLAKNVLVVGAAQFGVNFISAIGGFDGVFELLVKHSKQPQTLHSADGNEQDQRHFSLESSAPVGCAYAAGVGATAGLLVGSSSAIRAIAKIDQQHIFGSDAGLDSLLQGQQAFLDHATGTSGADFAVSRDTYKRYKEQFGDALGIMILSGSHGSATTSGVISNFSLQQVGNPTKAHDQGLDFYRLDIAVATDMVLSALTKPLIALNPTYILSPELLMRAFQLDATPVRAVLASHDSDPELQGKLDPNNLKIGIRGNPFESLKTLQERQANGQYSA
jgi:hypothetical protein